MFPRLHWLKLLKASDVIVYVLKFNKNEPKMDIMLINIQTLITVFYSCDFVKYLIPVLFMQLFSCH